MAPLKSGHSTLLYNNIEPSSLSISKTQNLALLVQVSLTVGKLHPWTCLIACSPQALFSLNFDGYWLTYEAWGDRWECHTGILTCTMSNFLAGSHAKIFLSSPIIFYYLEGFHVYCDGKVDSQAYHKGHQHTKAAFNHYKPYILAMLFQTYLLLY